MPTVRRSVAIQLVGHTVSIATTKWTDKGIRASGPQWTQRIYINHPTIPAPSVSYAKTESEFIITYYIVRQILTIRYRLTGHCVV